jgi:hypothetical protein
VRWRVLLLCVAGGCSPSSSACRVDTYVASDELGQAHVRDCGQFVLQPSPDPAYTDEAMAAAQTCVLGALGPTPSPFELTFDVRDRIQHLRAGLSGAMSDGKLRLHAYAFVGDTLGGSYDPRPAVTGHSCESLAAAIDCTPAVGRPCLACQNPGPSEILCSF